MLHGYVSKSTGFFVQADNAKGHIGFGAKKVIVSAPSKGALEQTCVANDASDRTCVANDASLQGAWICPRTEQISASTLEATTSCELLETSEVHA